jgi:hypothetical protein
MIFSVYRRFCFVHIPKTGGTSIAAAYEPHMLFNDVMLGGTLLGEALQGSYRRRFNLHKHSGARAIAEAAGRDRFDDVFSFAILRDPADRMMSLYRWLRGLTKGEHPLLEPARALGFQPFAEIARRNLTSQAAHVKIDGRLAVTRLYRFDDLDAAWAEVCGRVGIAAPLGQANASRSERVEMTPAARARIEETFAEDVALYRAAQRPGER